MTTTQIDYSNKSILARGCDPTLSAQFARVAPSLLGNVTYIPTTNDADFVAKLKEQRWSMIYFAPGACRYSAANMQIPGGNEATAGWTLEEYRAMVKELQGDDVVIVETPSEQGALQLMLEGLERARAVR